MYISLMCISFSQGAASTGLVIPPNTFGEDVRVSVFVQSLSSMGVSPVSYTCLCILIVFSVSAHRVKVYTCTSILCECTSCVRCTQ